MMNKRKNSRNSTGGQQGGNTNTNNRSSPRARGPIAEGVYNNSHFLHAAASQVGNNVRVKTKGGVVVEGIFRTFSEGFNIALEVPHRYQNGADDKKINVDTVQDNLIIKLSDIVTIEAKDVDLEYPTRDTFQTDTAIASRLNGQFRHGEKELEPWNDCSDSINGEISLELDTKTNGWDANEMFSLNEKEHGIKTTFKDNLESYTVQLDRKDTMDFRKQEQEAERIANEIENNPQTKERLDLENGDEEAVFAAVVRPSDDQNSTNSNMINNSSSSETMTPPPSSQNKYVPKQQRNPTKMMPGSKMYSKPIPGPQQQQQQVQQTFINGGAGIKKITINPPHQFNQPPPTHYVTQQQQQQQQQNQQSQQIQHNQQVLNNPNDGNKMNNDGREMIGRENSNNNNNNNGNKSMAQPRTNMRIMNPPPQIPTSFSEPPPQLNQVSQPHAQQQVSNQHMGKPINMHIPPPHLQAVQTVQQQDGSVQQTAVHVIPQSVVVVAHPSQIPIHPAPQAQRPQRDPIMRSRGDDMRSLRQFHNDFQMAPPTAQVPQQSQAIQTMPQQQQQQRPEMQDNSQMVHIPQQNSSVQTDSSQQQHMKSQQHVNSNNNNGSNANINHHVTRHPTPSSTPHQEKSHTPPQANTPQQNVNNSVINNSSSSGISTGTNSNTSDVTSSDKAPKKFTLNPQAKPFTPRNPSTPNQSSRPHTPQTPGPMAQQQPIPPPQQPVVYAPTAPLVYIVSSQQRPAAPATLARKTQFHQFQVTQATGQPIFNPPAPPQAVMPYHPTQMQTVQSQTYPQAIRMYPHEISAQQQPHLTSYLVPTPPSTTPSPGQPQSFHPGPQQSAGQPHQQAFQPPGSYVMLMPSNAPPFVYNQHNPQSFQIVSSAMPQQQHPAQ